MSKARASLSSSAPAAWMWKARAAVHNPERGPAVRQVLEQLLAVLDVSSPDGVI